MKVLWIVNIVMPELAEFLNIPVAASGSWLVDISNELAKRNDIDLFVACIYGDKYQEINLNNKKYIVIPGNGKNMLFYTAKYEKVWQDICARIKPDLIHIHGTEYSHGLSCQRAVSSIPSIISIQGMLNRIKDVDLGEIPIRNFIFGKTLSQWLHFNGEYEMHLLNSLNAKHETEMLEKAVAINGVSTWDTSIAKGINPKLDVFKLEYNLRDEYYSARKWQYESMDQHTIFTNPGSVPLKGLHMLIKAAALLLHRYPDIMIRVPGLQNENGNVKITSAYTRYLHKLIIETGMTGHIEFLGKCNVNQMISAVQQSHITVIPSAIEGASLVLREAMYLGAPCIATFRGGMADFVSDKVDGFLYDYPEYTYLADRIDTLFQSREICEVMSQNAQQKAAQSHSRTQNVEKYIDMYRSVVRRWKEK